MPAVLLDEPGVRTRRGEVFARPRRFARAHSQSWRAARHRTVACCPVSFSAVLLCGGESRRMGRDKATVAWNGAPLWQSQLATLRALQPATIFLSAREEKPWRPPDVKL